MADRFDDAVAKASELAMSTSQEVIEIIGRVPRDNTGNEFFSRKVVVALAAHGFVVRKLDDGQDGKSVDFDEHRTENDAHPKPTAEEAFEERVSRLIELAKRSNAQEIAGLYLQQCEEQAYLRGQYSLIDILRRELDKHDLRIPD